MYRLESFKIHPHGVEMTAYLEEPIDIIMGGMWWRVVDEICNGDYLEVYFFVGYSLGPNFKGGDI